MNLLIALAFLCLAPLMRSDEPSPKCVVTCEPDDEFFNTNNTSDEWDMFMNKLENFTFQEYPETCDPSVVDATNDLIKDLRFKLYTDPNEGGLNSLHKCFCDYPTTEQDCKSEGFSNCAKEARKNMTDAIDPLEVEVKKFLKENGC